MSEVTRREVMKRAAAAGAAALAVSTTTTAASDPLPDNPKHNTEPAVESTATPERYGPRELFAVVDERGNLKRGFHVVSSKRLDLGVYEVVFNRDVRRGVYLATPGGHGYVGIPPAAVASVIGRATDPRAVLVYIANLQGDAFATGFHLLVVCPDGFA